MIIAGASSHPGKFGFVALHNLLSAGYTGAVAATNLEGGTVLGVETVRDIAELPNDTYDLVVVCTPAAANPDLLRACAAKGVRAAFVTSAGYGEAGEKGRAAEADLVALARELGMLLAGPNGQGVVSTPASLCAQIVAPYPPRGAIGLASQSGNFVSSFLNYARFTGVGISRAVSAGNAAAVSVADYLDWYADDPRRVGLAYLEGVTDGRALFERLRSIAARQPLVILKGGTTAGVSAPRRRTPVRSRPTRRCSRACRQAGITRRDGRGGVRGCGDVRHATAAERPAHGRRHDRRRLGRRDRRRDHPIRARAPRASRRPPRRDRRQAAAALEPQQPDRSRRR